MKAGNAQFYLGTWTGRLIVINCLVYLAITAVERSLSIPSPATLVAFGARDPISLAHGEVWRLLTPIFLHLGILHFILNNLGLKVIGGVIEKMVGGWWFLIIYLVTGIASNIVSAFFNTGMGGGASGAIFGLVGVGVVFEQLAYRLEGASAPVKLRQRIFRGPFTSLALINFGLAIVVNLVMALFKIRVVIDNAAHIGGLAAGMVVGYVMLRANPNALLRSRPTEARLISMVGIAGLAFGTYLLGFTPFIKYQMLRESEQASDPFEKLYHLSRASQVDPGDKALSDRLRLFYDLIMERTGGH